MLQDLNNKNSSKALPTADEQLKKENQEDKVSHRLLIEISFC